MLLFLVCLCFRRPGSHILFFELMACGYAYACVVKRAYCHSFSLAQLLKISGQ